MPFFTEKRIGYELEDLTKSKITNSYIKSDNFHIIKAHNFHLLFEFYLDENYPFSPPTKVLCNNKDLSKCNGQEYYCYACQSYLCGYNWSPTLRMINLIEDYIYKLHESKILHFVCLILKRKHIDLPIELKQHICSFIF